MSGRGRGAFPKGTMTNNTGPLTRSAALALSEANANRNIIEFTTPSTFDQNGSGQADATIFDKQVNDFVDSQIPDETERARRGLELINQSPTASQTAADAEQRTAGINRQEVEKIIADSMRLQTESLTQRFSAMMVNYMNDLRPRDEPPAQRPRPQPHYRPNPGFANPSEPNDSYQNLFTRPPQASHNISCSSSANNRSNYIRKEDFSEIKFDGKSMNVRQFIFKLRTLKEANDVSWEYIVKNFYRCVKDHADTWYWGLVQKVEQAGLKLTWNILQDALENDFGGRQAETLPLFTGGTKTCI